jgi:hypothetical protein
VIFSLVCSQLSKKHCRWTAYILNHEYYQLYHFLFQFLKLLLKTLISNFQEDHLLIDISTFKLLVNVPINQTYSHFRHWHTHLKVNLMSNYLRIMYIYIGSNHVVVSASQLISDINLVLFKMVRYVLLQPSSATYSDSSTKL